jgi:hypothetical protein
LGSRRHVSEFEEWRAELALDPVALEKTLRRLVWQKTDETSFPPGENYTTWSREAVDDFVIDLFKAKGKDILLTLLEAATSKGHFERAVLLAVERHLIDQAKKTPTGKLRRRLVTLLGQDTRFVHTKKPPPERWSLAGQPTELWQGDIQDLHRVADRVTGVAVTTWNEAGPTAAPVRHALVTVAEAVISGAGRAVRAQDLAQLLRERFVLIAPLKAYSLDLVGTEHEPEAPPLTGPEDAVLVKDAVDRVWSTLDDKEQRVLPYMHEPARFWCKTLGLRRKVAELLVERVKEKVFLAVPRDEHTEATITMLRERSRGRT